MSKTQQNFNKICCLSETIQGIPGRLNDLVIFVDLQFDIIKLIR